MSADTVVPQPENPQDFNRYSYVHNNPLRYTDPTGHDIADLPWNQIIEAIGTFIGTSLGVSAPGVVAAVGTGALIGVGAYGGAAVVDWAIADNGPDYPMPAEYVAGAVQATYVLPGASTLAAKNREIQLGSERDFRNLRGTPDPNDFMGAFCVKHAASCVVAAIVAAYAILNGQTDEQPQPVVPNYNLPTKTVVPPAWKMPTRASVPFPSPSTTPTQQPRRPARPHPGVDQEF